MNTFNRAVVCCAGLAALSLGGLMSQIQAADPKKPAAKSPAKEEHDHPHEGPHGGALVELGDEEYHAEIVMEEKTHSVIIYLLGSNAKDAVPIEATDVAINLKHGDKAEQFKLKASPAKNDPKGKASRFVLKDDDLMHDLHDGHAEARLRVKISGKSYSGKIEPHDHDHEHKEHAASPKKK